jgi:putative transposase
MMPDAGVIWNFFDSEVDVGISERKRPHWEQAGAITFVTIRLLDSMPKAVVQRWYLVQEQWLAKHGLNDMDVDTMLERVDLPRDLRRAFTKFRNQHWNEQLDLCHGACVLRKPEFAEVVRRTLLHFDGQRYDLERFVIMPNHIHLLVQMRSGWSLRKQCRSWMQFSATRIHKVSQSSGHFWAEPFDHVVRDEKQFEYLREYIAENPVKAKLKAGEFDLWIRGK